MIVAQKTLKKVSRMVSTYDERLFIPVVECQVEMTETKAHFRKVPNHLDWTPVQPGSTWGEMYGNAWFRTVVDLPDALAGKPIYLQADTQAWETLVFAGAELKGIICKELETGGRGFHHTVLVDPCPAAGKRLHLAIECYAGHPCIGCHPLDEREVKWQDPAKFRKVFSSMRLVQKDDVVARFVFDLKVLVNLMETLEETSFRKGAIAVCLEHVFMLVTQVPNEVPQEEVNNGLKAAIECMKPLLAAKNGDSAPTAAVIGHSHMDTAWLWPISETVRKCARTFSEALNLMEQYPEYCFIQSSVLHLSWMEKEYPELFQRITKRIREGRWEPNGASWIEPDCMIPSGESFIRQLPKARQYTMEHFGYAGNIYWIPDSFGFSAALPQILKGCGVPFFATTKVTWNEINRFPYDSFRWRGIDGSEVIAHIIETQVMPTPQDLIHLLNGGEKNPNRVGGNPVRHKDVTDKRLIAYGYGDGGGGPMFEGIEMLRRMEDLEDCPKTRHTKAGDFMETLAENTRLPVYHGELYLEGHRGTLTSLQQIKKNNRRLEAVLHDLDFMAAAQFARGEKVDVEELDQLWKILLLNQFHDILPGTTLPEVHDKSIRETENAITEAEKASSRLAGEGDVNLVNSLSWSRTATVALDSGLCPQSLEAQKVKDVNGRNLSLVQANLPPFSSVPLGEAAQAVPEGSPFSFDANVLSTPFARITFNNDGEIESCIDSASGRELCGEGPLNRLIIMEDFPWLWDNWDVDSDSSLKQRPALSKTTLEVVASGPLQFRLRRRANLGRASFLIQDVIASAHSPQIDFETRLEWSETHSFLQASFPLSLYASFARYDIPFGHLERTALPNTSEDLARFEVCAHKWTDISENRFGVAFLNDGKYGCSYRNGEYRLSLAKSGGHPDPRGDKGVYSFTYSLLPHAGGFTAPGVARPAYELNAPVKALEGMPFESLCSVEQENIIVETVKVAESGDALVLRLYEAERQGGDVTVRLPAGTRRVALCDMIEREERELAIDCGAVRFFIKPFQIITLKVGK